MDESDSDEYVASNLLQDIISIIDERKLTKQDLINYLYKIGIEKGIVEFNTLSKDRIIYFIDEYLSSVKDSDIFMDAYKILEAEGTNKEDNKFIIRKEHLSLLSIGDIIQVNIGSADQLLDSDNIYSVTYPVKYEFYTLNVEIKNIDENTLIIMLDEDIYHKILLTKGMQIKLTALPDYSKYIGHYGTVEQFHLRDYKETNELIRIINSPVIIIFDVDEYIINEIMIEELEVFSITHPSKIVKSYMI